ncbi:MAG: universal stress protein [Nitrosopumilus sp.]|nr:universal stress protein [Nitrosopumilus sp.]
MKIKKIAVPYDGSINSKHAFNTALDLAGKYKAKLILVTCIEKINGSLFGKDLSLSNQKQVQKFKEKISRDISKLEAIAKKQKISMTSKILITDHPMKKILSFTKQTQMDLIVMGSHGRTGLDKLILGSVANGVVQRSKIPVLIVR